MHEKFESRGNERMLGLKLGHKCKGDEYVKSDSSIRMEERRIRSVEKVLEIQNRE